MKKSDFVVGILGSTRLYILDLISAFGAWVFIWFEKDKDKLKRRVKFVNDAFSSDRKSMLPYKIWIKAYQLKGIYLKNTEV